MKYKKSQLSMFIILGFLIIIGLVIVISVSNNDKDLSSKDYTGTFSNVNDEKGNIEEYFEDCIDVLTNDAMLLYGPDGVANFIKTNFNVCKGGIETAYPDFKFYYDEIDVKASRNRQDKDTVNVNVEYGVTFENRGSKSSISDYSFDIPLKGEIEFDLNPEGKTKRDQTIRILDSRVKLFIPKDMEPLLHDGPLEKIEYEIKNEPNKNLIIDFSPSGAMFEWYFELRISYADLLLPEGFNEDKLAIGVYDNEKGKFVLLQNGYVNKTTKEIVGKISHFSEFTWGIIRMGSDCEEIYNKNFNDFVNQVYANVTQYKNGTINTTYINNTINSTLIEAKQKRFDIITLNNSNFNNETNLTKFNITINITDMNLPFKYQNGSEFNLSEVECNEVQDFQKFSWFPPNHMWVGSGSKPRRSSKEADVNGTGRYALFGGVDRIEYKSNCQGAEEFHMEVNGNMGPVSKDDPDACRKDQEGLEYLGQFNFNDGTNTIEMVHEGGGDSAESVGISHIYLTHINNSNLTYFWIDNNAEELRFKYQLVLPKAITVGSKGICDEIDITNVKMLAGADVRNTEIDADIDVTFPAGFVSHQVVFADEPWPEYTSSWDPHGYGGGKIGVSQGICWYDTVETKTICGGWDWNVIDVNTNIAIKGLNLKPGTPYGVYLVYAEDGMKKRTKIQWVTWPSTHAGPTTCDFSKNIFCGAIVQAGNLEKVEANCVAEDEIDTMEIVDWVELATSQPNHLNDIPIKTTITDITWDPGNHKQTWIEVHFEKPDTWNWPKWWLCWKLDVDHDGAVAGDVVCKRKDDLRDYGNNMHKNEAFAQGGYPYGVFVTNKDNTERSQIFYIDSWPETHSANHVDTGGKTKYEWCYEDNIDPGKKSWPYVCTWWSDKVSKDLERIN